ncbi:MAG: hypothetical protein PHF92_06215 [Bacteroidales bacterium]|nr:hypothetical protein [Bacteroidales bacterium]
MNTLIVFFRFIYRLRYWLLLAPILTTGIAFFLTSSLPTSYEASTTIFTGITSSPDIDEENVSSTKLNNTFDNIIYLVQSRTILEKLSIRLFTKVMMNGDPNKDNEYCSASSFIELTNRVPNDVKKLIDKDSEERTISNLTQYKMSNNSNYMYGLLNWFDPHYSINALKNIKVNRLGSSDMINLNYSNDDPGIVYQTLKLLNDELISEYTRMQLSSSDSVIDYFQNQLTELRSSLQSQEDSLIRFSRNNNIVDYTTQKQILSDLITALRAQYEQATMDYYSSSEVITELENKLEARTRILEGNQEFITTLNKISFLNEQLLLEDSYREDESDLFSDAQRESSTEQDLKMNEQKLYSIIDQLNIASSTKEGIQTSALLTVWLTEVLQKEKANAKAKIIKQRIEEVEGEYLLYMPLMPVLKRQEREISIIEQSYLTIHTHLADAKLQEKKFQMFSNKLHVVSPPIYPLFNSGTKRRSILLITFFGSIFFILGSFLIPELFDRTLRDKYRATALSKATIIGAFPGNQILKYRRYANENNRSATAYLASRIMEYFTTDKRVVINLISKNPEEGKSFIAGHLKSYWEEFGYSVKWISYHSDFNAGDKQYFESTDITELVEVEPNVKIVIVEHPPVLFHNIPKNLLTNASANLYIALASRAWQESDQLLMNKILAIQPATYLLLNKTKQFAVEDFTGLLQPHTKFRQWAYRLLQLELTTDRDMNVDI